MLRVARVSCMVAVLSCCVLPGLLELLTTGVYDAVSAVFESGRPVEGHVSSTLQALLDILHDILRHVSDVVRKALQVSPRLVI